MRSVEVCVIGGGASGMFAAIEAARQGFRVLLLEKKNRLGKKLLATGNGKCNFTNRYQEPACYHSSAASFPWEALQRFGSDQTMKWFEEIGILPRERDGYIYPASGQASSVLRALERELVRLRVEIHTEEAVVSLEKMEQKSASGQGRDERQRQSLFRIVTERESYQAGAVVLAVGGKASPVHGSTGDGYVLAGQLGHTVISPVPALTSLVLEGRFTKLWSGARLQGRVMLQVEGSPIRHVDQGEIQLVAQGISGIPVFQLSRFAAVSLGQGKHVSIYLDALPQMEEESLLQELCRRKAYNDAQSFGDLLDGMLPDRFVSALFCIVGEDIKRKANRVSAQQLEKTAHKIKQLKLPVKAVSGFEKAQVTAGGVSVDEVFADTMESKLCRGLFLTGELLDVDGICGGYNLQWAWTTGYLAAHAIGKEQLK
ncbi:MAG: NAD(P)/FAD-dependent oxidoreductase [Clostridiaceae bacterium]|nr:NAD(P)/FAD-dependent oxidoreductase [Clostridiaceae bacterium]